ncbi:MAG: hypothetical protein R2713_12680 [Ilumatobacteraceae bacterium]
MSTGHLVPVAGTSTRHDGEVADVDPRRPAGTIDPVRAGSTTRPRRGAVLAVAIAVVLVFTTAVATTELGVAMVHRQRAQHAADAAALAGLDGAAAGAARLAGHRRVSWRSPAPARSSR